MVYYTDQNSYNTDYQVALSIQFAIAWNAFRVAWNRFGIAWNELRVAWNEFGIAWNEFGIARIKFWAVNKWTLSAIVVFNCKCI